MYGNLKSKKKQTAHVVPWVFLFVRPLSMSTKNFWEQSENTILIPVKTERFQTE